MDRGLKSMSASAASASKPTPALRGFAASEGGATAVEFAIVAAPFFALVFAILETALIFFSQQTLETAVANAAREVRVGIAQQNGYSDDQFKDRICQQVVSLLKCEDLMIDVRTYSTFDGIPLGAPAFDPDGNVDDAGFTYQPGGGSDIVTVRAFYQWPTFAQFLGLGNMPNGKHLLSAASAFRNEPFPW
jgi:Flp pilus assembly protein TadG